MWYMFAPYLGLWQPITDPCVKAWLSDLVFHLAQEIAEIRQRGESNDEFGEEVRRLVTQAYHGTDLEMQDQLAAEAFLRCYRNSMIAFDVLNKAPKTLNAAIEMVTCKEHNYRVTVGQDYDHLKEESPRCVTLIDESDDN